MPRIVTKKAEISPPENPRSMVRRAMQLEEDALQLCREAKDLRVRANHIRRRNAKAASK